MYESASYEDLRTMFLRTLVIYKGSLVFVSEIGPDRNCALFWLKTQKQRVVQNPFDSFTTQAMRIGMVNIHSHCVYVERLPVRKWRCGVDLSNLSVHNFPEGGENYRQSKETFHTLTCSAISDAVFGVYPTYKEVYDHLQKFNGVMAFDKQFAISSEGDLYYKTTRVGSATQDGPEFTLKYQYLKQVMGAIK
jgi:hypothetical protein